MMLAAALHGSAHKLVHLRVVHLGERADGGLQLASCCCALAGVEAPKQFLHLLLVE
jgi:hypothetical protein